MQIKIRPNILSLIFIEKHATNVREIKKNTPEVMTGATKRGGFIDQSIDLFASTAYSRRKCNTIENSNKIPGSKDRQFSQEKKLTKTSIYTCYTFLSAQLLLSAQNSAVP